ncbi:unnamed protein product [Rotaria magnacalcarata]|uniref:Uncharacterized protein n=1 Tax=Rotaria magnacalcarata TaxID=392030 RepID=A0A817AEU5_9BILA|nr:unnamed protein product [Rotaria magnacalcarata]
MTARTNAFTHVLFKSGINNELMIATLDKCNIQDDDVSYTCGGKVIYGELLTVRPKTLCDKLMKQMNGYSTDDLYSSLPEEKDQDDSDQDDYEDDYLVIGKGTQFTNPVSTQLPSSNITRQRNEMTNNNEATPAIETVENFGSLSSYRSTIEFVISTDLNVQVSNRSNETSINLPSNPMVSLVPAAPGISQINRSNKNTSTNQKTHRKQAPVPLLSSSSSNNISPSERLANIEDVLDNLSICVITLGEDVASIILQLKSLSKMIKIIQNMLYKMVLFEVMSTLRLSLKEARTQLTKDVRYRKVMKPKATDADSNENVLNDTTDSDDRAIQLLDEQQCLYDE